MDHDSGGSSNGSYDDMLEQAKLLPDTDYVRVIVKDAPGGMKVSRHITWSMKDDHVSSDRLSEKVLCCKHFQEWHKISANFQVWRYMLTCNTHSPARGSTVSSDFVGELPESKEGEEWFCDCCGRPTKASVCKSQMCVRLALKRADKKPAPPAPGHFLGKRCKQCSCWEGGCIHAFTAAELSLLAAAKPKPGTDLLPEREDMAGGHVPPHRQLFVKPGSEIPLREGQAAASAWKQPPMQPLDRELPSSTSGRAQFVVRTPITGDLGSANKVLHNRFYETTFAIGPSHCAAGSMLASEIPCSVPCTGIITGEGRWTTSRFVLATIPETERPTASFDQIRMTGTHTLTISPHGVRCYGAYLGTPGTRVYWQTNTRDISVAHYGAEIIAYSSQLPIEPEVFLACRIGNTEFGNMKADRRKSMYAMYAAFCTTLCTWQSLPEDLKDHDGDSIVGANCLASTVHDLVLLGESSSASYILRCSTPRVEYLARKLLACWDIKLPENGVPCCITIKRDESSRETSPWSVGHLWCDGNPKNTPRYVREALERLIYGNQLWVNIEYTLDGLKECVKTSGLQSLIWREVAQDALDGGPRSKAAQFGAAFKIVFTAAPIPLAGGGGVTAAGQIAKGRQLNSWVDGEGRDRENELTLPRSDYHWERGATILIPAKRGPPKLDDPDADERSVTHASDELLDAIFMMLSECNVRLVPSTKDSLPRIAETTEYNTTDRIFWFGRADTVCLLGDPRRRSRRVHPPGLPSLHTRGSELSGPVVPRRRQWLADADPIDPDVIRYVCDLLKISPPKEAFDLYDSLMEKAFKKGSFPTRERPLPVTDCNLDDSDFRFIVPVSLSEDDRNRTSAQEAVNSYGVDHDTSRICEAPEMNPTRMSGRFISKCTLGVWFLCAVYLPTEGDAKVPLMDYPAPKASVLEERMSIPGQPIARWISLWPRLNWFTGSYPAVGRDVRSLGRGWDAELPDNAVFAYVGEPMDTLRERLDVLNSDYAAARLMTDEIYKELQSADRLFDSIDTRWKDDKKRALAEWRSSKAIKKDGPPKSITDPPAIWVKTLASKKEASNRLADSIERQRELGIELSNLSKEVEGPKWEKNAVTLINACADIVLNPGGHRSAVEFLGDGEWRAVFDTKAMQYEKQHPMREEAMTLFKIALACTSLPRHMAQLIFGVASMPLYSAGPSVVKAIGSEAHRALAAGKIWKGWSMGGLCEVQRLLLKATKLGNSTSRLPKVRLSKPPGPFFGHKSPEAMRWLGHCVRHTLERLRSECNIRPGEMPGDSPRHLCMRCKRKNDDPCPSYRAICMSCGQLSASTTTKGGGTIALSRLMGGGVNMINAVSGDNNGNLESSRDSFWNQMNLLGLGLRSDELQAIAAWFSVMVPGGVRWQECPGAKLVLACIVLRNMFDLCREHSVQVSMLRTFEGAQRMPSVPKYGGLIAADGASASDGLTHAFLEMVFEIVVELCGPFMTPNKVGGYSEDVSRLALEAALRYRAYTYKASEWANRVQPSGPLLELTTPSINTPGSVLTLEVTDNSAWEEADWVLGWFMKFLMQVSHERIVDLFSTSKLAFIMEFIRSVDPTFQFGTDDLGYPVPDKPSLILCADMVLNGSILITEEDLFKGYVSADGGGVPEFAKRLAALKWTFQTKAHCLCGLRDDGLFRELSDSPLYGVLKGPPNRFDGNENWIPLRGNHLRRFLISSGQVPYITGSTGSGKTLTVFRSSGWFESAIVLPTTLSAILAAEYVTNLDGKPTMCIHYKAGASADPMSTKGGLLFAPELMSTDPDTPGMMDADWPSWDDKAHELAKVDNPTFEQIEELAVYGGKIVRSPVDKRFTSRVRRTIFTPWQIANNSTGAKVVVFDEAQELNAEKGGALARKLLDGTRVVLITATPPPHWLSPTHPLGHALVNIAIPGQRKKTVKILTDYRLKPPSSVSGLYPSGSPLEPEYFTDGVTLHLYGSIAACIKSRDSHLKESGGVLSPVKHLVLHGELTKGDGSETDAVQKAAMKGKVHVHSTIGMAGSAITLGDVRVVRIDESCRGKYKSWGTGADAPSAGLTEASLLQALGRGARVSDCAIAYLPQGKETDWHPSWQSALSVSGYRCAEPECQFMNASLHDQLMVVGNPKQYTIGERIMCAHILACRLDAIPYLEQAYYSASSWVGDDFSTWVGSLRDEVCCSYNGRSYNPKLSFTQGLDPAHRTNPKSEEGSDRLERHAALSGDRVSSDPHFAAGVVLSLGMGVSGYSMKTFQKGKYDGGDDRNPLKTFGVNGAQTSVQTLNVKALLLPLFEADVVTGNRIISAFPMGGPTELCRPRMMVDGVEYSYSGPPLPNQSAPTVAELEALSTSGRQSVLNERGIAMGSSLNGSVVNMAASQTGKAACVLQLLIFCSCYLEKFPFAAEFAKVRKPILLRGVSPPGSHNSGGDDTLPCGDELTLAIVCILRQQGCGFEINWGKTVGGFAERGTPMPRDFLEGSLFSMQDFPDGGSAYLREFGGIAMLPAPMSMGPFLELYYRQEGRRVVYRSPGPGVNVFDNFDSLFSGRVLGDTEHVDRHVASLMTQLTGLTKDQYNAVSSVNGDTGQPRLARYSAFNSASSSTTIKLPLLYTPSGPVLNLPAVGGKQPGLTWGQRTLAQIVASCLNDLVLSQQKAKKVAARKATRAMRLRSDDGESGREEENEPGEGEMFFEPVDETAPLENVAPIPWQERPPPPTLKEVDIGLLGRGLVQQALWCGNSPRAASLVKNGELMGVYFRKFPRGVPDACLGWVMVPEERFRLALQQYSADRRMSEDQGLEEISKMHPEQAALELSRVKFIEPASAHRCKCLVTSIKESTFMTLDLRIVPKRYISALYTVCSDQSAFRQAMHSAGLGVIDDVTAVAQRAPAEYLVAELMVELTSESTVDEVADPLPGDQKTDAADMSNHS